VGEQMDEHGPLVQITYRDAWFDVNHGDSEEPCVAVVVGWELPPSFADVTSVASERISHGYSRAVTHIWNASIVERIVLDRAAVNPVATLRTSV
jgi:hypothetical protein